YRPPTTAAAPSYEHPALVAQLTYLALRVARAEDRRAGDERVRSRLPHGADRLAADAAIHLQRGVAAGLLEHQPSAANLVDRMRDELLPAKPRVHRHHEQQIEFRN